MKTSKPILIIMTFFLLLSCREEDKKFASIVGKWKGTLAEIQVKPFGLPTPIGREDENFAAEIEFRSDDTVILLQNGQPIEGSYQVVDEKLITDIEFNTGWLDITGTYTIQELSDKKLVFFLERKNETITDPDSGTSVSGDIKATLHFERI